MMPSKLAKFDSEYQAAYLSLWRTYDRLRMIEDELFSKWNLTPQQYNVLRLLQAVYPGDMPTLQVSQRLVSRAPDITRMLDRLESSGWIARTRSDSDRRTVLVGITDAGLTLVTRISKPLAESHLAQLGHMSDEELQVLCELLRKVREPHESESSSWR